MFRKLQIDMIESGVMDYLSLQWLGKGIPGTGSGSDLMILSVGQVVLIFIVMGCMFGVTGIVFILEITGKAFSTWYRRRKNRKKRRKTKKLMMKQDDYFIRYPDPNVLKKFQSKTINMTNIE